jgi:hypothetical protein
LGTIENVRASAERPGAASIALRDHRLSENANIEKLGQLESVMLQKVMVWLFIVKITRVLA